MENNYDLTKYILYSNKLKINEEIKVILIADMHDYTKNKKRKDKLANFIKEQKPHHIIIAGDNIQGYKWEKPKKTADFKEFVENLSQEAPVFISLGNHDLHGINEKNKEARINNFKSLSKKDKIFPLINDLVNYDKFEIIGYTSYDKLTGKLSTQTHGIAHDAFIKDYEANGKKPKDSKKIIEFVGHNPHIIASSENELGLESLNKFDTFYTGHLHNGYYKTKKTNANPDKYLDTGYVEKPYIKDHTGKIIIKSLNPFFFGKTNLCRGIVYLDEKSNQKILLLNDNHYYQNESPEKNNQVWVPIREKNAREVIIKNNLHALVITGGVNKFFSLVDKPEITEVIYKGIKE